MRSKNVCCGWDRLEDPKKFLLNDGEEPSSPLGEPVDPGIVPFGLIVKKLSLTFQDISVFFQANRRFGNVGILPGIGRCFGLDLSLGACKRATEEEPHQAADH